MLVISLNMAVELAVVPNIGLLIGTWTPSHLCILPAATYIIGGEKSADQNTSKVTVVEQMGIWAGTVN